MAIQGEKTFRDVVIESVGEEIFDCYQCYKCSAGCPISFDMDLLPHQIIRSVVFNQKEKALSSKTIWLCASCETCTTRCPNEIDIAKVMDVLRQIQRESGMPAQEPKIPVFHKAFLNSIKKKDLMEKVKAGTWKDDVKLGMKMFFRGKLKLLPPKCTGVKEVQKLFEQAEGHKKR